MVVAVIDEDGFRANVGIIIANDDKRLFWGKRIGQEAWQFPQGGINPNESVEEALFRELYEEVGLEPDDVELLGITKQWLRYRLPEAFQRTTQLPLCIGQKQKWVLLRLTSAEDKIQFGKSSSPEFDGWRWVSYWYPVKNVINFKKKVYRRAMQELRPLL